VPYFQSFKGLPNVSKYPTEVTDNIRFVMCHALKLVNCQDSYAIRSVSDNGAGVVFRLLVIEVNINHLTCGRGFTPNEY